MARLIPLGESVTRGERKMLDYLQRHLPNDWIVFGNPLITTADLTRELDAIVVGNRCIWVIDEKGFGGCIIGDEYAWILSDGSARERVINNVLHAASMVKGRLVAADARLTDVWVEGLVLLTADDADLRVRDQRTTRHVRPLAGCEKYFVDGSIPQARPLQPKVKEAIEHHLAGQTVVDRLKKRFARIGPYHIIETISSSAIGRNYRAERQKTSDLVELKVYDLSAIPEQKTREETRRFAEREFEALLKLRDTQGIIRIADSFQPVEGYGGELYYFALDLPAGPCLASRIQEQSWPFNVRLSAVKRLCEVASSVHEVGVTHRNLNPSCIHFWRTESDFQLTGFEFSRLPTSTINIPTNEFPIGPYTAPEITISLHNASKSSDVYSLGIILFEIFSGHRPFGNRTRNPDDQDPIFRIEEELFSLDKLSDLNAILQLMLAYDPNERVQDLKDVIDVLNGLCKEKAGRIEPIAPPAHPLPQGAHLGEFTVLAYLGTGGCFHAYRVAKNIDDTQEYVAKVVRYPELLEIARREFSALSAIDHTNIIRAYEVSVRADAPYHLLEVYAQGETARDFIARGPTPSDQVAKWAVGLADALVYMETRNPPIYHGDISPRNIILDKDHPCLVDFGLAYFGDVCDKGCVTGTAPYRAPERDMPSRPWPKSGDVYSLGVVLCELLFGELPYLFEGGKLNKQRLREDLFEPRGQASREFLGVLHRAVDPNQTERFNSAVEFQHALICIPELSKTVEPLRQTRCINHYLSEVLKVYNRGVCNAENRGMDSTFARATYVPTELDKLLLPNILAHKYALVVLTGNPGDGKTAFLQQLALHLSYKEESLPLNHWSIEKDGWTFECVLDGSAADSGRGLNSDEILDSILAPLKDVGEKVELTEALRRTQLLAINDGRLLEYLYDRLEDRSWVVQHLLMLLGERIGNPHPQIILADLKQRSLVTGVEGDTFDAVLSALLNGGWGENRLSKDPWKVCRQCRAAAGCHVLFNVDTLIHPKIGPQIRKRLKILLMIVHSRGRLHITMRELRSMLTFLIFGDQTCEQIHTEQEGTAYEEEEGQEQKQVALKHQLLQLEKLYFKRLFIAGTNGGRLFEELSDFDPAYVDNPRFDRLVAAAQKSPESIESLFTFAEGRIPHVALFFDTKGQEERFYDTLHVTLRRRYFFEGRKDCWGEVTEDDFWLEMTAFHSTKQWIKYLTNFQKGVHELPEDLCRLICRGISRTDNVPDELLDRFLAVRTASSFKTDLVVVRLFDLSEFTLVWEKTKTPVTVFGEIPRAMLLHFAKGRDPTLEISSDLFEVLMRFAEGYRMGAEELEGVAAHLQLFKNRLLAMPAKEVCLLHPTFGQFKAKQELVNGVRQIIMEELV